VINITIRDHADEYRVEITGRFSGTVVDDVLYMWRTVELENSSRRFTVDITNVTGYDYAGCDLLREMNRRGVHIAAGSPLSLVHLNEISGPRKIGPALVRKVPGQAAGTRVRSFPLAHVAHRGS
jgi:hypothetical protein